MARIEINSEGGYQLSFTDYPDFNELEGQYLFLPYSDLRGWIPEGDPWLGFEGSVPLGRLDGIKQLSFLSYVGPDPDKVTSVPYEHTRGLHTQQVALISREIVRRNGGDLSAQHMIMVGGGLHDIATPAHGDATKLVDPNNLKEEDHWEEMIGKRGKEYLTRYGISAQQIDDIIHNRGVLGQVLDIADRIAYVMQDSYVILGEPLGSNSFEVDPYTSVLRGIMLKDLDMGNIYKDVQIDWKKEQVVFGDLKRLEKFLYLRAHLHQQHYLYPRNQGRDMVVANLIKPFYSPTEDPKDPDLLTPAKLRQMGDLSLMDYLAHKYGVDMGYMFYGMLLNLHPKFERFERHEEADEGLRELTKDDNVNVLGKREVKPFDTGGRYLAVNGSKIETFNEASSKTRVLNRIVDATRGVFVFYLPKEEKPIADILEKAQEFQKQQDALQSQN
jgi:HD superfamily phosphohydrolase